MDEIDLKNIAHSNFCAGCDTSLHGAPAVIGFHPAGWRLEGHQGRQWIAFHCEICGYDTSLDKLGIPRP